MRTVPRRTDREGRRAPSRAPRCAPPPRPTAGGSKSFQSALCPSMRNDRATGRRSGYFGVAKSGAGSTGRAFVAAMPAPDAFVGATGAGIGSMPAAGTKISVPVGRRLGSSEGFAATRSGVRRTSAVGALGDVGERLLVREPVEVPGRRNRLDARQRARRRRGTRRGGGGAGGLLRVRRPTHERGRLAHGRRREAADDVAGRPPTTNTVASTPRTKPRLIWRIIEDLSGAVAATTWRHRPLPRDRSVFRRVELRGPGRVAWPGDAAAPSHRIARRPARRKVRERSVRALRTSGAPRTRRSSRYGKSPRPSRRPPKPSTRHPTSVAAR